MDDMLRGVATYGTAARARAILKRNDIAGKTGTTNESVDAWFSGYTPSLAATAWLGYDQPKSLGSRETGGGAALPIWLSYMQEMLKGVPEAKTAAPARRPAGRKRRVLFLRNFHRARPWRGWGCRAPGSDSLGDLLNGRCARPMPTAGPPAPASAKAPRRGTR